MSGGQETRLVIAIDYGTTFTGVAWAVTRSNRAVLDEIELINDWGLRMGNQEKIPSVISYSESDGDSQQWGSDLSKHAIAMVHTKLQLDIGTVENELDLTLQALEGMDNLHYRHIKNSEFKPSYPIQSPEEIVQDYLRFVFEYLLESVGQFTPQFLRHTSVDIVVTIPAEWGYRAKNSTFRALSQAGFNNGTFKQLKRMMLVSEPEAAAIYTARFLNETYGAKSLPKIGESFVLCDAGGGTVDVISYKVKALEPVFEIEAVGEAEGKKCGAIFINIAFKTWLRELIGTANYQMLDQAQVSHKIGSYDAEGERMRILMKDFDNKKKLFTKGSRDIRITLPEPLDGLDIPGKVEQGQITITYEDMECFFEPCIVPILEMIKRQRRLIEDGGTRLKNVFLVGGFAESPYLQTSINEYLSSLRSKVDLRRPDTSLTAVVRGAAIFGIEKSTNNAISSMSACPRSYGISADIAFSEIVHDPAERIRDETTMKDVARDQLKWLIKKGDLILSDQMRAVSSSLKIDFKASQPKRGTIPIFAYDDDDLPDSLTHARNEVGLSRLASVDYDLSPIPPGYFQVTKGSGRNPTIHTAVLNLNIRVFSSRLRVTLSIKDRQVTAEYIPDPALEGLVVLES